MSLAGTQLLSSKSPSPPSTEIYVSSVLDTHGKWNEFEADCHCQWANKFGSQFITNGAERNVLRRKLHFLTNDVYGRLQLVAIGLSGFDDWLACYHHPNLGSKHRR